MFSSNDGCSYEFGAGLSWNYFKCCIYPPICWIFLKVYISASTFKCISFLFLNTCGYIISMRNRLIYFLMMQDTKRTLSIANKSTSLIFLSIWQIIYISSNIKPKNTSVYIIWIFLLCRRSIFVWMVNYLVNELLYSFLLLLIIIFVIIMICTSFIHIFI